MRSRIPKQGHQAFVRFSSRRRFRKPSARVRAAGGPAMLDSSPPAIVVGRTLSSYFVGGRPEQPGDDHLHRLQRAGRPRDRRAADDHAGTRRDVRERLAAARPERPEPGLEPGDDPRVRPRERDADRGAGRARSRCSSTPVPRRSPRSTPAPSRPPRPPRRCSPGNVSDPSLLASTPDANTTDPFIQEEAAAARLRPAADLQLPAHADRLQLVPRLGARARGARSGRAPAMRSTSPAWAWP